MKNRLRALVWAVLMLAAAAGVWLAGMMWAMWLGVL